VLGSQLIEERIVVPRDALAGGIGQGYGAGRDERVEFHLKGADPIDPALGLSAIAVLGR
jgi:hypothetical protein